MRPKILDSLARVNNNGILFFLCWVRSTNKEEESYLVEDQYFNISLYLNMKGLSWFPLQACWPCVFEIRKSK